MEISSTSSSSVTRSPAGAASSSAAGVELGASAMSSHAIGMQLKAGTRLKSSVCETQVMVVKAPSGDADLTCGGAPMVGLDADPAPGLTLDPRPPEGTLLGKRYADEDARLALPCTQA